MLSYVRFLRILIWLSSKIDLKIRDILFLLLIDYRYYAIHLSLYLKLKFLLVKNSIRFVFNATSLHVAHELTQLSNFLSIL